MKKVKLTEVGKIITGNTPPTKNHEFYSSDYVPFYKPNDIEQGYVCLLNDSKAYLSIEGSKKGRIIKRGAVLVTCIGIIGKVGVVDSEIACFNQQMNAIEVNNKEYNPKYIAYCLIKDRKRLESIANAPVVPIINKTQFSDFEIEVHDLSVQKKIVETLDKAQFLIDRRKEQIKLLDELVHSVFIDMFGDPVANPKGWKHVKVGQLYEVKTGGTPSRKNKEFWSKKEIPWVKTTEVKENIILDSDEYISRLAVQKKNLSLFPKDTILVAMYGQGKTRGMTAKLGFSATTNQACAALLPSNEMITDFVWYYLRFSYEKLRALGRGGNQPNLNLSLIKDFELVYPPINLQSEFLEKSLKIEKYKEILKQSLEQLETNFNSIMQKAFKGELFN